MLSPKTSNQHCSNMDSCETGISEQQHYHHRSHPTVDGGGNSHLLCTHNNETNFLQSQKQLSSSSNIYKRGSSSNILPPPKTNLSSTVGASVVGNSTLRRKNSLCYQQQLLADSRIVDASKDCGDSDISLPFYNPHPSELFLYRQFDHQRRKPNLEAIEPYDDSLACCLPPPSPAPNSDRFVGATCIISPPTGSESQRPQKQILSSPTSNSSISSVASTSLSLSTSALQPSPSNSYQYPHQHILKYSTSQSTYSMQCAISTSTTRYRTNIDRYRDISPTNSSTSVNNTTGRVLASDWVVTPSSSNRFVNFPHHNCTTPSLSSVDTYSYLASTVHTPVKRYIPTPPPSNQMYATDQQNQKHQQQVSNIQTPTRNSVNKTIPITKINGSLNTESVTGIGSFVGTSTSATTVTMPYRLHAMKCCITDQFTNQRAAILNLGQANDFYTSSQRIRSSYNRNKIVTKDSAPLIINFNESQATKSTLTKNSNSTTQTHMASNIMGYDENGSTSSPPTANPNKAAVNARSQIPTFASKNGICSLISDLQESIILNSTSTNFNDANQQLSGCRVALRSEEFATSMGLSIESRTSSTCLHCKTVKRTTGVHQTTQTTGSISPVPKMAPLVAATTSNSSSSNSANKGFNNDQINNITMTLTSTPAGSTNHLTPISFPKSAVTPSNRIQCKKLDISLEQMFPQTQMKIKNNNQVLHTHFTNANEMQPQLQIQQQPSNLDQFLPSRCSLNQRQQPLTNQPITQTISNSLMQQQQQQQQRYSCKKRFTHYMRREVLKFFGIELSTEVEDYGLWQGRQRRLAIRRFGIMKAESELQAELNDVCLNDNASHSKSCNIAIRCSTYNNEGQYQHYHHHHHHSHQRYPTERPDILPIQDTVENDTIINNGIGDVGNNEGTSDTDILYRQGCCQRNRYHRSCPPVGDHVERKASVARMLVQSVSFIKHVLNKKQPYRYKRHQWSRSFAPAHVQYQINDNSQGGSNEFYEGLSALQDDEVFFDSPPGVEAGGVIRSTSNSDNNSTTGISTSFVNSTLKVTSVESQLFIGGERNQQGWRTSNIMDRNKGSITVHQPNIVYANAEHQISHQQQQQSHCVRGTRISAQILDGVLENSQRLPARTVKFFCANDLDDRTDHRPFFTYWINTVQIVVLFFSLLCYGIGPIGFGIEQRTSQVLVTSLSLQTVRHSEQRNVWIGPRNQDLVHIGAKFATCMRRDVKIIDVVMQTRRQERETACCIRSDDSGCVQSSQADCSVRGLFPTKSISTWKKWSAGESGPGGRISGSVCGLDPKYCDVPASIAPYEWPDDITKWPICRKTNAFSQRFRFKDHTAEHMVCEVIGHPCCTGIYGECQITTREYCDFVNGYFHEEASLCSQISCLSNVCGMFPFVNVEVPDQIYRLLTSLCIHAGILHLVITVVFQHIFLADLERLMGPIRTAILYIGTGLAGNLTSAVLVPYKPEVGPLASLSGVTASLVVLLIHAHWQQLDKPHIALFKLITISALFFAIGTLPWQLNFASLFAGIFCGIFLTVALVPFVSIDKYRRKSKINLIWSCVIFHIFIYATMLVIFYMFSTELTKPNFDGVLTNSFNTGVRGNAEGGATGSLGITTTDIIRTGISRNSSNNIINRHSFTQQHPLYHHHHLSDNIYTNNAAVAVAVATATLPVGEGD